MDTWRPAEDGNGTILRFLDLGGISRDVTVTISLFQLSGAWLTDAVERNQGALPLTDPHQFRFTLHPHEIVTVRIKGSDVLSPPLP